MLILAQWAPWLVGLLVVGFVIVSVALMLIILLQKPQGGGLSEAFGASGGGAGNTAFGARVGDALTMATIVIFITFLATAITLNFAVEPSEQTLADQTGSAGAAPTNDANINTGVLPNLDPTAIPAGDGQGPELQIKTNPVDGLQGDGIEFIPINPPIDFDSEQKTETPDDGPLPNPTPIDPPSDPNN